MHKRFLSQILIISSMALAGQAGFAASYTGNIQITEKGRPAAAREYADLVVFFTPKDQTNVPEVSTSVSEMRMENKNFIPRVLTVTMGSEVEFPNFDPVLHNAFSTSGKNRFDLGFFGGGEKKSQVFEKPGLVRVYCNVHHDMVAYILVLNTPYFTSVDAKGKFSFQDLPEVSGQLQIWHPRARGVKKIIDLSEALEAGEYQVAMTKRRIPKHLNKKGKSYSKSRRRRY